MNNKCVIIDYGIGGFHFYLMLKEKFPKLGITYFSDTGTTPYGKMTKNELKDRIEKIALYFKSKGYKHIIYACHSASSAAITLPFEEVENIITPTQQQLNLPKGSVLGVVGGGRTVRSKLYANYFMAKGIKVQQRIAQELSVLIETADWTDEKVSVLVEKITKPLRNCDYLLLACTHYPIFIEDFKRLMPDTVIIDPVDLFYNQMEPKLKKLVAQGQENILSSGNKLLMEMAIEKSYGVKVEVKHFELN